MNTIQISINVNNREVSEQLVARLSYMHFDAFEEKENELIAFIREEDFNSADLKDILAEYDLVYTKLTIEEQNWNAVWESNFDPVMVDDFCLVRAEFHEPDKNARHEIIITPKMSFGTGHHATTYMMMSQMSKINFSNRHVADFGTGTGVLAILAEKLGSGPVLAIDHDDWSIENACENIERNGCSRISIEKQDNFKTRRKFDIILANINKNVILANADTLVFGLNEMGSLLLSGLLGTDKSDIVSVFTTKGLKLVSAMEKAQWISLLFSL